MTRTLAALLLCAATAHADHFLAPGGSASLTPEPYLALNPGSTHEITQANAFVGLGSVVADLQISAVREPGGSVDFVYQLWNSETYFNPGGTGHAIASLTLTGFGPYSTGVGDSDGPAGGLSPGGTAATTASRSADGSSITFTFAGGLAPLAMSDLLFVRTDADSWYATGTATIVAAATDSAAGLVAPATAAVPEPGAVGLMGLGIVTIAGAGLGRRLTATRP